MLVTDKFLTGGARRDSDEEYSSHSSFDLEKSRDVQQLSKKVSD
jgi:hypothetical protein